MERGIHLYAVSWLDSVDVVDFQLSRLCFFGSCSSKEEQSEWKITIGHIPYAGAHCTHYIARLPIRATLQFRAPERNVDSR